MGYFPVRYNSRVVIYEHKMFIRFATGVKSDCSVNGTTNLCPSMLKYRKAILHYFDFILQHPRRNKTDHFMKLHFSKSSFDHFKDRTKVFPSF